MDLAGNRRETLEAGFSAAEQEVILHLGEAFLLPEDPAATPAGLKTLLGKALPYHVCSMLLLGEPPEGFREMRVVRQESVEAYTAAASGKSEIVGLIRKSRSASRSMGGAIQPSYRPFASGEMDRFLPGRS